MKVTEVEKKIIPFPIIILLSLLLLLLSLLLLLLLLLSLLFLSPLLENSFFSRSLLSPNWISKSLMSSAFSKNLLKSFFFTNLNFPYQRSNHRVLIIKMFYVLKQNLYWILIFYNIFWDWIQFSSKASRVQSVVHNMQIYFALYFFTKFTFVRRYFLHPR